MVLKRCLRGVESGQVHAGGPGGAVYVGAGSDSTSRMGGEEFSRSFRGPARAADRFLHDLLCLRGGDRFNGKSNLATSARKQRSSSY